MATKTDAQLDGMVFHIRYEVARLIDFLGIGNQWVARIEGLPDAVGTFAAESMLEAALVHARCVAEFLRHSGEPEDTITARDYIPDWHWIKGEGLKDDLAEIHGRVTHLGLIRLSVQHEGTDFRWDEFLTGTAIPTLLRGFREFLRRLEPDRLEQFNQPGLDVERIDFDAVITAHLGP
jgi:hypothetical protein